MAKSSQKGQNGSRVDEALRQLRLRIERRELMPGEALRLDALSQELNMSVQPVREALRILESEGLVERSINRGVVVAKVSLDEVIELACLRTVIEPMLASLATVRATADDLAKIREYHEKLRRMVDQDTPTSEVVPHTIEWHRLVYAAARSRFLSDFITRVWTAIRINSAWRSSHAAETVQEHEQILKAMEERDPVEAARAMRIHVRDSVIGHLEGYVGASNPMIDNALATYDALLGQIDPATPPSEMSAKVTERLKKAGRS